MIPDAKTIGARLKTLRGERSMQEMADVCGVSRQAYWKYEAGEIVPSDEVKQKIANFYGVNVGDIFFALEVNNT